MTFEYGRDKVLLDEASFSLRAGSRVTLMGQNGAGKSTLFKMIMGETKPQGGDIHKTPRDATVAIGRQVMPPDLAELTVREYFATAFKETKYNLDKLIKEVFKIVNANLSLDKKVKEFSGGQQARLLLAHALIQKPDLLLLDEPTNNLDQTGIEHLTGFLMTYDKTCMVISHDADFLNAFSDGVLYLDSFKKKIEQYTGNYYVVVEEIKNRIERENLQNARMQTQIKEKRSQAEVFAHKGGKLRAVAKRMRESAEEAEEGMVETRQEDKTIREFKIPAQEFDIHFDGKVAEFEFVSAVKNHKMVKKPLQLIVRKNEHVLVEGPNGIGKTTLLEKLASGKGEGIEIPKEVRIGYYKQDFGNMNYGQIAYDALKEVMAKENDHDLRSTAAGFLLDGKFLSSPIRALSEGQKGLLAFCRLVLMRPGLLILDEPTNHINFRHLPIIASALDNFGGAIIMVSHIPDFVSQIHFDSKIDLEGV